MLYLIIEMNNRWVTAVPQSEIDSLHLVSQKAAHDWVVNWCTPYAGPCPSYARPFNNRSACIIRRKS
jgi:hypothetical protein